MFKDVVVFFSAWIMLFFVVLGPACFVFMALPSGDLAWSLVRLWLVVSGAVVIGAMVDDARK